jgi:hypothetical protein
MSRKEKAGPRESYEPIKVCQPKKWPEPRSAINERGDEQDVVFDASKSSAAGTTACASEFGEEPEALAQKAARPLLRVRVDGEFYHALLDSGATNSLLGGRIGRELRAAGYKLSDCKRDIGFTIGDAIITKTVNINIAWNGGRVRHKFFILPDETDQILLGQDFLGAAKIDVSISRGGWFYADNPNKVIPFDKTECEKMECHRSSVTWLEEVHMNIDGPDSAKKNIGEVVAKYHEMGAFTKSPGLAKGVEHEIDTGTNEPYRCKPRPMNKNKRQILEGMLEKLLEEDIIEPCVSRWGCCPVIVEKKGPANCAPNYRLCIDYRPVNKRSFVAKHEMPRIDWIFAQLGQAKVFTTIDLSQGYHQIRMRDSDKDKTAFVTQKGMFRYKRMPFGLAGSGFTFQRAIDDLLDGAAYSYAMAFIDDIVVFSPDYESHAQHLDDIFRRLTDAGFTINPEKVNIAQREVQLLGHIVKEGQVLPDPEKTNAKR